LSSSAAATAVTPTREALVATVADLQTRAVRAREAIVERDAEIRRLQGETARLREALDGTQAADRELLAAAAAQARRDAALAELRREAAAARAAAAEAERALAAAHESERALRRALREAEARAVPGSGAAHVAYIKNVVVKYLSFADGTAEKARLRDVLARMLGFEPADEALLAAGPVVTHVPKVIIAPHPSGTGPSGVVAAGGGAAAATAPVGAGARV
jgi:hypothetical protein